MKKRVVMWGIVVVVLFLVGLRLALPSLLKGYVNRTLSRIPEYSGSVADIDVALIRGAYSIRGLKLQKKEGKIPIPFLSSELVDLSIQWSALFEGKLVGEVLFDSGKLNFVSGPTDARSQTHIDDEWLGAIKDLFPLRLNRFGVKNFEITYSDFYSTPQVKVVVKNFSLEGSNFSNTRSSSNSDSATIDAHGMLENVAPLAVKATVNPGARAPTFRVRSSVEKLPLKSLNDFLKAYAYFDVQKGTAAFYLLLNAKDGKVTGALKPIIKDMEVFDLKEEHDSFFQSFWELTVEGVADVFTNHHKDQIATVVPLEGQLNKIELGNWSAFVGVLRNAFIQAISPSWKPTSTGAKEQ